MRILFITTLWHTPWGGSEELWTRTARHALGEGAEVGVLAYRWKNLHPVLKALSDAGASLFLRHTDYRTRRLAPRIANRLFGKGRAEKQLIHIFQGWNPDVILVSQGGSFDMGYPYQRQLSEHILKSGIPYLVISQNNPDAGYVPEMEIREVITNVFETAKEVLFVARRNLHVARRQLHNALPNGDTIWNPVKLEQPGIKPWNPSDTASFAVVAALKCAHKGQDMLFEVLSSDRWKNRNWILNLYGQGEDAGYLVALARYFGIEDRVVFHGHVDDIGLVWEHNHLLLMPSLGEGMPLALQEAMLCGRCAVASDVAGIPELVIDGKTGFLAEAATIRLFDHALEAAWKRRDEWKSLGEQAFKHARQMIDLHSEITLYRKLKTTL